MEYVSWPFDHILAQYDERIDADYAEYTRDLLAEEPDAGDTDDEALCATCGDPTIHVCEVCGEPVCSICGEGEWGTFVCPACDE